METDYKGEREKYLTTASSDASAIIRALDRCMQIRPVVRGSAIDENRLKAFLRKDELEQVDRDRHYYIENRNIYSRGFLKDPKPTGIAEDLKRITSILTRTSFTDPERFNPTGFDVVMQITGKFLLRGAYSSYSPAAYEVIAFNPLKLSPDGKYHLSETVLYTKRP